MTPIDEQARLARLRALRVLDSAPEDMFDALVLAAAAVTGMPMSLLSLIDENRQWFKANVGLPGVHETPREYSFCQHVVAASGPLEVHDATKDPRFEDNPFVTGAPDVRAYTGFPVQTADGVTLGALCVLDKEPRQLTPQQLEALAHLAEAASVALERRRELLERRESAEQDAAEARRLAQVSQALEAELRGSQQFLQRTGRVAGIGGWELDLRNGDLRWSEQTYVIHDLPPDVDPRLEDALTYYPPDAREVLRQAIDAAILHDTPWDLELPFVTAKGRPIWVRTVGALERENDVPVRLAGAFQDVTDRRRAIEALQSSERRFRQIFELSLGLICTHDFDGTLLSINPAAAASLGFDISAMLGRNLAEFMMPARRPAFEAYLERIQREGIDRGLLELIGSDGGLRYWRYQNAVEKDVDESYVLGHAQDVTEQHRYEQLLVEWSTKDPLTRAFNRRYLERLEQRVKAHRPWACIVIDLNHFKAINDTFGHQRGDEILVATVGLLHRCAAERDAVVRLGGDEFLMVIDDPARLGETRAMIEEEAAIAEIALSIGGTVSEPGEAVDTVIARADGDLYAGREGRHHRSRDRQET
ncbi:diguanylate cyclase [Luteibacter sp. 3190]|uniref:sensor domain-containing diguanylate cyclase n=1 Tax=Luteibacter sp. 3190 TaxID=2817736 RepID=UPI00285F6B9E|nr:diguanylate cyclase [Luteibacter sp. 3190]MDR6935301.1 diguanylate cyclase (GGDEF)-like protein/PAS domain S-box-containing protein [Luteibacter sp. 3190]